MKRLFLLRHAKAVPAESGVEDFDRTLMLSGMQDAGAMARHLRKSDYSVGLILCSSAARLPSRHSFNSAQSAASISRRLPVLPRLA